MKYLLIIAIVLIVFWLWRNNRQAERNEAAGARPRAPSSRGSEVMEMVACDFCHVHLPRSDALIGPKGIYCSDAHRREAKG